MFASSQARTNEALTGGDWISHSLRGEERYFRKKNLTGGY